MLKGFIFSILKNSILPELVKLAAASQSPADDLAVKVFQTAIPILEDGRITRAELMAAIIAILDAVITCLEHLAAHSEAKWDDRALATFKSAVDLFRPFVLNSAWE